MAFVTGWALNHHRSMPSRVDVHHPSWLGSAAGGDAGGTYRILLGRDDGKSIRLAMNVLEARALVQQLTELIARNERGQ